MQGAYPPPGYYYPPPPRRPWSSLAVGGFITSLLGLGLIGLPASIAGIVVTQRHPQLRGSALAILGTVIGIPWAVINVNVLGAMLGYV